MILYISEISGFEYRNFQDHCLSWRQSPSFQPCNSIRANELPHCPCKNCLLQICKAEYQDLKYDLVTTEAMRSHTQMRHRQMLAWSDSGHVVMLAETAKIAVQFFNSFFMSLYTFSLQSVFEL